MTLLCEECSDPFIGDYQVLYFLGHTRTGCVLPSESAVRMLVCRKHSAQMHWISPRNFRVEHADTILFALAPAPALERQHFKELYRVNDAPKLKSGGNLEKLKYLTGWGMRAVFPNSLAQLISEFDNLLIEIPPYSAAVRKYQANVKAIQFRGTYCKNCCVSDSR